jgi:excisionase family DNA binding protein
MEPTPDMLISAEVAALFQVDPRTVTRWVKEGHLIAVRPTGGKLLFPATQPTISTRLATLASIEEESSDDVTENPYDSNSENRNP